MSLIENMARRFPAPMDMIQEIERLKEQKYSNVVIGEKLDISDTFVAGLLALKHSGEERLLDAALKGKIPLGVATEIAKAEGIEAQRELLKAYESKQLNQASIRAVRRIIEQRRFLGKARRDDPPRKRDRTTAEGLVNAYKRHVQRQKLLVKKAKICEARLLFVVNALKSLVTNENFINLLRAEQLATMPDYLAARLKQ
jgi:ParB family chromosome partitioning protein